MSEEPSFHREILIVNKPLQHRMIRDICLVPITCLVLGSLASVACFWVVMQAAKASNVDLPGVYGLIVSLLGLVFVTSCIITIRTAVYISHRVAGPLHRLHKAMDQICAGSPDVRIHFRKKDYIKDTAVAFNALVDYVEAVQYQRDALREKVERLEADRKTEDCKNA